MEAESGGKQAAKDFRLPPGYTKNSRKVKTSSAGSSETRAPIIRKSEEAQEGKNGARAPPLMVQTEGRGK